MMPPELDKSGPPAEGLGARQAALAVLTDVFLRKKLLDDAMERARDLSALPSRDRAFARMMISTVLRRKGQLDDVLRRASDKGDLPRPDALRFILYLGIVQILFMNVPDHAAVDSSVRLAESEGLSKQKGFVNAVLRRLTREGREWVAAQDEVALNFPDWMIDEWRASYGPQEAAAIAQALLTESPLDITLKNPAETALWLGALEASYMPAGTLRRQSGGMVIDLPGFREGAWWVQSAASTLPVKLMGDIQGLTVIDLCAAPGGKTMQLRAAGAKVIAVDSSTARLRVLKENLARVKLSDGVETVIADSVSWRPKAPADIVLLDAPCSATGTVRKHPDLLHTKTAGERDGLIALQQQLLDNAAKMVKPGGMLVYATCSLQTSEGEDQARAFLSRHPEFTRMPADPARIGHMETSITKDGDVRVLPTALATLGGMDGFFVSVMEKPA